MNNLTYGSVCSGIEAATAAWHVLGWRPAWFAEIEDFPSRVLAHHYPDVPNLGDMTQIAAAVRAGAVPAPDVLVGGTPCQAFSVAGLRESLDDARGQLTLSYVELANAIDDTRAAAGEPECIIVWENVPGVLNTKDNAFGCFLGALAGEDCALEPPGGKWPNAGCVSGPKRAIAWRVLDAQYFGVAQRRRRVFVVASAREGFDPAEVLFEFDGVRRDTPPSREAGQETAGALTSSLGRRSGQPDCGSTPGLLQPVSGGFQRSGVTCMAHGQGGAEIAFERSPTLTCNHEAPIAFDSRQDPVSSSEVFGALGSSSPQAQAVAYQKPLPGEDSNDYWQRMTDYEREHNIDPTAGATPWPARSVALRGREGGATAELGDEVAGCLRASTGGGDKPHVLCFSAQDYGNDIGVNVAPTLRKGGDGGGVQPAVCITGDITRTLKAEGFDASEDGTGRGQPIVTAFSCKDYGNDVQRDLAPTMRAMGHSGSHANAGGQLAVQSGMAVRRLTPRECERLQGFPDDYTLIQVRGKPAADGPRYKALGNSMAVPCMRWIGQRIVQHLSNPYGDLL